MRRIKIFLFVLLLTYTCFTTSIQFVNMIEANHRLSEERQLEAIKIDAINRELREKEVRQAVQKIINDNQGLISHLNLSDKYLNGVLIRSPIYKDGFLIRNITLRAWIIYVLSTNTNIKITGIQNNGIEIKSYGKQSRIVLFEENAGELYVSHFSVNGGLIDVSYIPELKNEVALYLTSLTSKQ